MFARGSRWRCLAPVSLALFACSPQLSREDLKEHVRALRSSASEARLLNELRRGGRVTQGVFQAEAEAISDRAADALAALTRRPAPAAIHPQQEAAITRALLLGDALRALIVRPEDGATARFSELRGELQRLEQSL